MRRHRGNLELKRKIEIAMSEAPPRWRPPPWCKPPQAGRTPKLEVHDGETLVRTIPLDAPKLTLGRQAEAVDLHVDDGSVSRTHCALLNSATGTFIMDLDSRRAPGRRPDDGAGRSSASASKRTSRAS